MADEKTQSDDVGLVERAFLMGVGAAVYAKDKVEELADELVQRGKMTSEKSDSFVKRVTDQADDLGKSAKETITKETERVVAGMGLASAKDIEALRDELTEIKALIASLRPVGGESEES
jgi:polyhydroxyalkanoate synthesis regulator phasin